MEKSSGQNEESAKRWERYALSLLSGLIGLLWVLFWNKSEKIDMLERESDKRLATIVKLQEVDSIIKEHSAILAQRGERITVIEGRLNGMEGRLNMHGSMLQNLSTMREDMRR